MNQLAARIGAIFYVIWSSSTSTRPTDCSSSVSRSARNGPGADLPERLEHPVRRARRDRHRRDHKLVQLPDGLLDQSRAHTTRGSLIIKPSSQRGAQHVGPKHCVMHGSVATHGSHQIATPQRPLLLLR